MIIVKREDKIKVHYTGKFKDGKVFDSSLQREPLEFTVGAGQMIPGFDNAVVGMALNSKKTIEIPCAEAYGEKREELINQIPKTQLPEGLNPEVGQRLVSKMPDGQEIPLTVTRVDEETITIDANHPLAGEDLTFEIEIVAVA